MTGVLLLCVTAGRLCAQENPISLAPNVGGRARATADSRHDDTPVKVLSPEEWQRVDAAVDRALSWLAAQQQPDGSFPTMPIGQPGVTSLCAMAFMSHGHVPGEGPYGTRLERATDYVLSCQKENGLLALVALDGPRIDRNLSHHTGVAASYDHAISSFMLSEMYGLSSDERAKRMQAAIDQALAATLEMQRWPKDHAVDRGGWRYINNYNDIDSDLSITGWQLMFLRSARNAGFNVPKEPIDEAVAYVQRCYSQEHGVFLYSTGSDRIRTGMAGAGILALAHAGFHGAPEARSSAEWILAHDFDRYNVLTQSNGSVSHDRYHYAVFNCCQGMYQMGGRYWEEFFPRTVRTLLDNQQPDGSWQADSHAHDGPFGSAYTTALMVLSLGAPNQLLPIFQR